MKIGFLQKREDGRFELQDENGNYITYFTSGEPIEIFVEGYGWINGRVEPVSYTHLTLPTTIRV